MYLACCQAHLGDLLPAVCGSAPKPLWLSEPACEGVLCAGLVRELLPDVAHLLRHPCGASVIAALWDRAPAEQRNAMAATFYGKEFSVLSQVLPAPWKRPISSYAELPLRHQHDGETEARCWLSWPHMRLVCLRAAEQIREAVTSVGIGYDHARSCCPEWSGRAHAACMQGPYPASLGELLKSTGTALKRQAILQQLTMKLHPIMEKGMVDAVLVHRCA